MNRELHKRRRSTLAAIVVSAQETLGGQVMTRRAMETIAISADLKAQALPAIDAWIKAHPEKQ